MSGTLDSQGVIVDGNIFCYGAFRESILDGKLVSIDDNHDDPTGNDWWHNDPNIKYTRDVKLSRYSVLYQKKSNDKN